ncbi:hypothetical protein SAMN02745150_01480 [Brevinema andersonii]|uniref:Uncharacterized protein n=1 Tax=Brevinema andersonii TaxID=34097 RepID=A0A1I1FL29_BREAD|nr:hypothetical protein [Brevinema andersonii]SFB97813.1 hypothetical protein SAMN02745150_01480 [Brevinema andersonii]
MKRILYGIFYSFAMFSLGLITGLKGCSKDVITPLEQTVTVEKFPEEVSSQARVTTKKNTQKNVVVSQTVKTERYGNITTQSLFPRSHFSYNHTLALQAFILNTEFLLGWEYRYKRIQFHSLTGYNYRNQRFVYGFGLGYTLIQW